MSIVHQKSQKIAKKYECKICNYNTSNKYDYNKHILTAKHKMMTNDAYNATNIVKPSSSLIYICDCGKRYKYRQGLYTHKRNCSYDYSLGTKNATSESIDVVDNEKVIPNYVQEEPDIPEKQEEKQIIETNSDYKNMFIELIKQNQDFKTLIVEQQKENQTLHKQLIDVVKEGKNINSNNTINNNQKFNLNFFLNNTCKDAMNMSEFIENLDVNFNDIEYIGRNGYVNGMTNMILSRIKDLDVTKRPLHCTDLKRETMYIKDNDEWNKDTPDNTQLRNMVKIVAKHNQYQFPLWREKHPASDDMNSETFEFSLKMIQNILGDVGEEQIKLDNKVMRNLSKHILVDKNV